MLKPSSWITYQIAFGLFIILTRCRHATLLYSCIHYSVCHHLTCFASITLLKSYQIILWNQLNAHLNILRRIYLQLSQMLSLVTIIATLKSRKQLADVAHRSLKQALNFFMLILAKCWSSLPMIMASKQETVVMIFHMNSTGVDHTPSVTQVQLSTNLPYLIRVVLTHCCCYLCYRFCWLQVTTDDHLPAFKIMGAYRDQTLTNCCERFSNLSIPFNCAVGLFIIR